MTELRNVDINLIVVLDAILREQNLTRAGESLMMSQSTVSGALARLSQHFDDPLLVRRGRKFELTPAAARLRPLVRDAMREIDRIFETMPTFDPANSTRTFLLSASDYVMGELTNPLLAVLAREAPGTKVEFTPLPSQGESVTPTELLRRDMIIAPEGRGIPGQHRALFSDVFVALVDADNPYLVDGGLSEQALASMPHVNAHFGTNIFTPVDDAFIAAGIAPRIAISTQGFLPIPFAVQGTRMVGFVPERIAQRHAASCGLTIARTPLATAMLIEAAYWHPSKSMQPAMQWLLTMMCKAAATMDDEEFRTEPGTTPADQPS